MLTGFILRTIFIKLILFTKQTRNSDIASYTMYTILIASFFNAGILYIIAPWSFAEQGVKDGDFFSGIYTDFTSQWFQNIGSMVAQTTAIGLIFPILEALVFLGLRILTRCLDQKSCCPCNMKNTRVTTIQKFEAIYSGPLFFAHYRLAGLINLVFIAFLYGPGIPMMFPITLAGLCWNLFTERIRMAYSYKKPPMFDASLSQKTLEMLGYAPILYFVMSIWLFSNQQVFRNSVPHIHNDVLYPLQDHTFA